MEVEGEEITAEFPLGDTYVEIDYHYGSGALFRHGLVVRVVDSFTWNSLGIDDAGNVDTGANVGWIIVPDNFGWVWSWNLERMIYLPEANVDAAGAWIYLPHNEVIEDSLEGRGDFESLYNWVDTRSILSWIYAPSDSNWVYASAMAWIYMPPENVTPYGVWVYCPR